MTSRRTPAADQPVKPGPRLSYLVYRLERRIRARLDEALVRYGITTTEYMALSELRMRDGLSSAELARIAFVTPQAMNLVVRDLEQRGLIHRDAHPDGGRVLRAHLTREGQTALRRCDRSLDGIEADMLAEIDDATRGTLTESLTLCTRALRPPTSAPQGGPDSVATDR
ncbi:MarR family transcriptional regulator [Acrocarpospora corrugata]|uniref:MarR family transcriptional regulator n=1 Tax=Acrocarpospora corrugata TaxID=35763 RepID=A0A5M3W791_9ACTN|nr:MarR family transcriptional regulator [Acrocarpospora corrugata]GES04907.1 MarR family transcriptional regulator [Acrocarpospora corrugata]